MYSDRPLLVERDYLPANFMYTQGRPQDLGGGAKFFFSDLGICMSLLGGFGGMLPREIFFKTMQFGAF